MRDLRARPVLRSAIQGEPKSIEEANQVIKEIQDRKGYLKESTLRALESISDEARNDVLDKFDCLRSDAVELIRNATTLNSSDAHFIHELLQNADDARYSQVLRRNEKPRICFHLSEGTIVVETNEDGFSRADVEAICETGKSSKKSNASLIGEKGLGFKSIFRIADQVRIASGFWYFHFDYSGREDELDMVTPLHDTPSTLPAGVGTRMVLQLNLRHRTNFDRIVKEFSKLPNTLILFLRNIKHLEYTVDSTTLGKFTSVISVGDHVFPGRKEVTKTLQQLTASAPDQQNERDTKYYQVFSSNEISMPKDSRRPSGTAVVSLAFPLDNFGVHAVVEPQGQHVFAYLPMYRKVQLNFLIHSDFITTANRESTEDCDWNDRLLEAIADTFGDAVVELCKLGVVVYEWPKYIPHLPIDGLLSPLRDLIIENLRFRPVFRTWTSHSLKVPTAVFRVPESFQHEGKPLLADRAGASETYLAKEYHQYTELLQQLRTSYLAWPGVVARLDDDLAHPDSRMKSPQTSVDWHTAMARYLLDSPQSFHAKAIRRELRHLSMVPLVSGLWVSMKLSKSFTCPGIYFPTISGVSVPIDIGYNLVDPKASSNNARSQLFKNIGVQYCEVEEVSSLIQAKHRYSSMPQASHSLIDHLYFFYRFNLGLIRQDRSFWVLTAGETAVRATLEIYLPSQEPYSTCWLLQELRRIRPDEIAAETNWLFHPSYFNDRLIDRPSDNTGWKKWLTHEAALHEFPALYITRANSTPTLSGILEKVLAVSSLLFLRTLQARWKFNYGAAYADSSFPHCIFQNCEVMCRDGKRHRLMDTYLPSEEVLSRSRDLGVLGYSKILDLRAEDCEFSLSEWAFLKDLNVRESVDVDFHLQALEAMKGNASLEKVVLAYEFIGGHGQKKHDQHLKECFRTQNLIYVPGTVASDCWYNGEQCVWTGPEFLSVKKPLAVHYGHNAEAAYLFHQLLQLPDASWSDLIDELRSLKENRQALDSLDMASKIYSELYKMKDVKWDQVRSVFEKEELVYVSGKWLKLQNCVWTSSIDIEESPALAKFYSNLKNFFTQRLGVKEASVQQIIAELIRKTKLKNGLKVDEAKSFIKQISGMLGPLSNVVLPKKQLGELALCKFLPVKSADEQAYLVTCGDKRNFVIRDHPEYSEVFADAGIFLDFTFEEFPQVINTIEALSLQNSYISARVQEQPKVGNDSVFSRDVSENLRKRALCLYSVGYAYQSPLVKEKDDSLLHKLQSIEVYTSSTISTALELDLGYKKVEKSSKQAQILLDMQCKNGKAARLDVPSSKKQQRLSIGFKLPEKLLVEMEIDDNRARLLMQTILSNPLSDLAEIMKMGSVPVPPWVNSSMYDFTDADEDDQDEPPPVLSYADGTSHQQAEKTTSLPTVTFVEGGDTGASQSRRGSSSHALLTPTRITPSIISSTLDQTPFFTPGSGRVIPPSTSSSLFTSNSGPLPSAGGIFKFTFDIPRSPSPSPVPLSRPQQNNYKWLLHHISRCAKRTMRANAAPSIFDFSAMETALPSFSDITSTFGPKGDERNCKIGAAGEFYVYEMLKALKLPEFGMSSWQSTLRHLVRDHDDYKDIQAWSENETADLVYKDQNGSMREWLRTVSCNGMPRGLDSETGASDCEYYLEVKTTTESDCNKTRFFMTNKQYNRMQEYKTEPDGQVGKIYVIIRVFNLMSQNIGMKVFVDPYRSRDDSKNPVNIPALRFEANGWDVYPTIR